MCHIGLGALAFQWGLWDFRGGSRSERSPPLIGEWGEKAEMLPDFVAHSRVDGR